MWTPALPRLGTIRRRRYDSAMKVTDEALQEYRRLWRKEFGEDITLEEARDITTRLLALYEALCMPLPEERRER